MGDDPAVGTWHRVLVQSLRLARDQIDLPRALRCAAGVVVPMVIGVAAGSVADGLAAAIGALSAGFASFQGAYRSRVATMAVVSVGMAASTMVGAVATPSALATVVVDGAWGVVAGMLVALGPAAMVVGLQWAVAVLVVSAIPMTFGQALVRSALVLAGGAVQLLLVVVLWPLRSYPAERQALAAVYRALADYARAVAGGAQTGPGAATIGEARAVLRDPQPFGRAAQLQAFRALLDEGERARITLVALARVRSRLGAGAARQQLDDFVVCAADTLGEVAAALDAERPPATGGDALRAALETLQRATGQPSWVLGEASDTAAALGGQVRTAVRVAAVAAGAPGTPQPPRTRQPSGTAVRRRSRDPRRQWLAEAAGTLRANLSLGSAVCRHALRLGATLAAGSALAHFGGLARGYWVGLTALVVLRPDFATTAVRGVSRVMGTLVGAVVATALVAWIRPGTVTLTVLFALCTLGAYLFVRANYLYFSVFVTGYVVFFLAFARLPALTTVTDRVEDTLLGGALAALAYLLWPTPEGRLFGAQLARLLDAQRAYAAAVLSVYVAPDTADRRLLGDLRAGARLQRTNSEAALDRMELEPPRLHQAGIPLDTARGILAAARRFVLGVLTLHAHAPAADAPGRPDLAALAGALDAAMAWVAEGLRGRPGGGRPEGLRGLHDALVRAGDADARAALLASETDLMVDSVNTLSELVLGRETAPAAELGDSGGAPLGR
jgi:uncharacterized membrane protein YccC